jgi:hypothetical protein
VDSEEVSAVQKRIGMICVLSKFMEERRGVVYCFKVLLNPFEVGGKVL